MVKAACEQDYVKQVAAAQWTRDHASDDNTGVISRLAAIDWTNVWMVIVEGSSNDWYNAGTYIGEHGSTDVNKTLGAINVIINTLLATYPHLRFLWISPLVRWLNYSGGTGNPADWSDIKENGADTNLRDYVATLANEVISNHIDFIDIYNTLGWNMSNFSQYFGPNDGTHPTTGLEFMGKKIGRYILSNVSY
jgi:hypothetical protein